MVVFSKQEFEIKTSIKIILLKNLLWLSILSALLLLIFVSVNLRSIFTQSLQDQAVAIADLVKAGLTSHMKADIMSERNLYLQEIREARNISRLSIYRSFFVTKQYGNTKLGETSSEPLVKQVFETGKAVLVTDDLGLKSSIRVLMPYIANEDGEMNCLECHEVERGTVLGVVDIKLDATKYRNSSFFTLSIIAGAFLLFITVFIIHTNSVVNKHIVTPSWQIIQKCREAYRRKDTVYNVFTSQEFNKISNEINQFNLEIQQHEAILDKKNQELIKLNEEIENTLEEIMFTMGIIESYRSNTTKCHTKRVTEMSRLLAEKAGLSEKEIYLVSKASPLHDIGKLGIPDHILYKKGKLSKKEYEIMKNHSEIGFDMLKHSDREIIKSAAIIAYQHQEKWDGTGYPQGLKNTDIHVFARVVTLIDVFDALSTARPYKEAWPLEKVMDYITKEKGKHFDPHMVEVFLAHQDHFIEVFKKFKGMETLEEEDLATLPQPAG